MRRRHDAFINHDVFIRFITFGLLKMKSLILLFITAHLAQVCILGEAAGESFDGKVAIGEAIRNRGGVSGVYGCDRAKFANSQDAKTKQDAFRAWEVSKRSSLTGGADHWESTDFKTPPWSKDMTFTVQIGKHRFYKGKK